MINSEHLKLVLFDFDDTLCIHNRSTHHSDAEYYESLIHSSEWWTKIGCESSNHMKEFMLLMRSQGVRLGLISQTDSYIHMVRKNEWVQTNYGIELENFCVACNVSKVDMMSALSIAYNIRRNAILLVDDKGSILCEAVNNGFQAASPMEVVNYVTDENMFLH